MTLNTASSRSAAALIRARYGSRVIIPSKRVPESGGVGGILSQGFAQNWLSRPGAGLGPGLRLRTVRVRSGHNMRLGIDNRVSRWKRQRACLRPSALSHSRFELLAGPGSSSQLSCADSGEVRWLWLMEYFQNV